MRKGEWVLCDGDIEGTVESDHDLRGEFIDLEAKFECGKCKFTGYNEFDSYSYDANDTIAALHSGHLQTIRIDLILKWLETSSLTLMKKEFEDKLKTKKLRWAYDQSDLTPTQYEAVLWKERWGQLEEEAAYLRDRLALAESVCDRAREEYETGNIEIFSEWMSWYNEYGQDHEREKEKKKLG